MQSSNLFQDNSEILAFRRSAGECARDVFPDEKSWSNRLTRSPSKYICISQLLCNPNLLHKQAGACPLQAKTCAARNAQILARAAPADDVYGRQFCTTQLGDVSNMNHVLEICFCDSDGKRFNFACPKGADSIAHCCQRKSANAVKQTSKRQLRHKAAAFATVFVMLIAVWAV